MKAATPTDAHRWLQQLVGEWKFEADATSPEQSCRGTERVRSLGELWIVAESEMQMPGGGVSKSVMTLGYDPRTGKFCGTWIGDMMAKLWIYEGELDASRRVLSLYSEGPAFTEAGEISETETARYRDQIELHEDGHRTFSGSVQDSTGEWQRFMLNNSYRVSSAAS